MGFACPSNGSALLSEIQNRMRCLCIVPPLRLLALVCAPGMGWLQKETTDKVWEESKMSLFDRLFSRNEKAQPNPKNSDQVIDVMLAQAESLLKDGKAGLAVEQYQNILKLRPHAVAQYNLGSLYAQGKGVAQDLCKGAYYFRQAEKNGDAAAAKMVRKRELDYMNQALDGETAAGMYERMRSFVGAVYPEETARRVGQELTALGSHCLDKKEYPRAVKLLRAAAEFCSNGQAQNVLGVLYNAGSGVQKNDLIALYWFDRAADQGIAAAGTDRDGILSAYRSSLSMEEFSEYMEQLARWCREGTEDIPKTSEKADRWHSLAQPNQKAAPSADPPQAEEALSIQQQRENIVQICMRRMPEIIQKCAGPEGLSKPCRARFDYPGTDNVGLFQVEPCKLDGKPYALQVGVLRANTDLLVSSYMVMGRIEDILGYLADESHLPVLLSTFQNLSESVDERWE